LPVRPLALAAGALFGLLMSMTMMRNLEDYFGRLPVFRQRREKL
jgi:hypothetical protein